MDPRIKIPFVNIKIPEKKIKAKGIISERLSSIILMKKA